MSYLYSGLIKCTSCGGNYRGRRERKHKAYICSTYNNYPDRCKRFSIREEELTEVIGKHLNITEINIDQLSSIEVDAINQKITIKYTDGTNSVLSSHRYSV